MTTIAANLQAVRARIAAACIAAGRPLESVRLLAVSKTWPAASVREAIAAGQRAFGENYVQEAIDKKAELASLSPDPGLEWHFIGPLQSNKTRLVAENFAWVHSVDRLKIAERLSAQRPPELAALQICLQVNVSGEASKSGCDPDQAAALAAALATLPGLRLRGLMAIPEPSDDPLRQRQQFAILRRLRDSLPMELDTLSMGMSHDLEAAIMEGSTLLRIGTAIFGQRNYTT
jgi:pyridoxal phosphate enzyme (YggS family)